MGVGWKGEVKQPHVVNLRSHITAILEGSGTSLSMMKQPQLPCKPAEEPRKRQDRHCGGLVEGNAEWLRKRPLPVRRGSVALATGLPRYGAGTKGGLFPAMPRAAIARWPGLKLSSSAGCR